MDEFDAFNQNSLVTENSDEPSTNNQEDDLFGGGFTNNTTTTISANPFNNEQQQQPDLSWALDDDLPNTSVPTPRTNIFDDNDLHDLASQTKEFTDDIFSNQTNGNEYNLYPTPDPPPTADDILSSHSENQTLENDISYNMFSNSVPTSTSNFNQYNFDENLSPLEAFNRRREQEIVEMDKIEKEKIEQLRQQGKKDLERWYEDRRISMERKRQSMKNEENVTITQALEKSDKNACDWAKVIRFLDFSQGTQLTKQKRDLNRMRTIIIQAKRDKDKRNSENGV